MNIKCCFFFIYPVKKPWENNHMQTRHLGKDGMNVWSFCIMKSNMTLPRDCKQCDFAYVQTVSFSQAFCIVPRFRESSKQKKLAKTTLRACSK